MFSSPAMTPVCVASHLILFLKIHKSIVCLFLSKGITMQGFLSLDKWMESACKCYLLTGRVIFCVSPYPTHCQQAAGFPSVSFLLNLLEVYNCPQFGFLAILRCNTSGAKCVTHSVVLIVIKPYCASLVCP